MFDKKRGFFIFRFIFFPIFVSFKKMILKIFNLPQLQKHFLNILILENVLNFVIDFWQYLLKKS